MEGVTKNPYQSMFRSLVARTMLVSFLPLVGIGGGNFLVFYHLNRSIVLEQHANFLKYHKESVEGFLRGLVSELSSIAYEYRLEELRSGLLERIFRINQARGGLFEDLGIIGSNGDHLCYVGPYNLAHKNYKETEWFRRVVEEGLYVSDMFLGFRGVPHFVIAIQRPDGNDFWILRATVNIEYFKRIADIARLGATGESFIINQEGLYQIPPRSGGTYLDPSGFSNLSPHSGIRVQHVHEGDKTYICSSVWIAQPKWLLIFKQETSDVFRPLWNAAFIGVLSFLGGGLVAAVFSVAVARDQVRRVQKADLEKEALTQKLLIAGRIAAIGEMSAGLAHEINNPLATIDTLQTWIRDLASCSPIPEEDRQEILESAYKIGQQVARCKLITQGLLKFSRMVDTKEEEVDVKGLLEELLGVIRSRARVEGVRLEAEIEELPPIRATAGHLQQVFANLINNAMDAVAGTDGAMVLVRAQATKGKLIVSVEDNGCGIPPENLPKIFTPFFTTKPVGKGTGLGLAICHGLVQNLGGEIRVESTVGKGSRFTVVLPLASAVRDGETPPEVLKDEGTCEGPHSGR